MKLELRAICGLLALCSSLVGCSRELPSDRAIVTREASAPAPSSALASPMALESNGVAVVELFTSEGCSSCPPADRVLAELTARAKADARPIYTLSFHVDYWNSLGWRDRFSSASYSERQAGYRAIAGSNGVYTPQIVVNGAAECIGSNAKRVESLIDAALQRAPRSLIQLTAQRVAQGIRADYRVSGEVSGRVLNLALLEPRAETQVERGENSGEHLVHVNVVRAFSTRALSEGSVGRWSLPAIPELGTRPLAVVAFVEAATQADISGASAVDLP